MKPNVLKTVNDKYIFIIAGIIAVTAITLLAMGRPLICPCDNVKLWHGLVDEQSSQHLTDWFTFQHFLTGALVYAFLQYAFPWMPKRVALSLVAATQGAWEVLENTPWIIEAFRDTAHNNYMGDSLVNSVADILIALPGHLIYETWKWPGIIAATILLEGLTLYAIHDSVLLNIIMLIYPFEAIRTWQIAAWP